MERQPEKRCLFCRLVRREVPADVVGENEELLAFNDINPQAPHHILVIPKAHIPTLNDITPDEVPLVGRMAILARELAEEFEFAEAGYRLVINCNRHAGQSIFHLHMHVLGGRFMHWPPGRSAGAAFAPERQAGRGLRVTSCAASRHRPRKGSDRTRLARGRRG